MREVSIKAVHRETAGSKLPYSGDRVAFLAIEPYLPRASGRIRVTRRDLVFIEGVLQHPQKSVLILPVENLIKEV